MSWEGAERLRQRLTGANTAALARKLGVDYTTLLHWQAGRRAPKLDMLSRLCRELNVSSDWILGLDWQGTPSISVDEVREAGASYDTARGGPWTLIPRVSEQVAAGEAIYSELDVHDRDWYAFREGYVKHLAGKNLENGRLLLVSVDRRRGESMLPTIRPGALVMVDRGPGCRGWTECEDGKIYLCRPAEEGVTVKRVFRGGDHSRALVLWSDNPAFKPIVVDLKGKSLQSILLGRVRWIGQEEE